MDTSEAVQTTRKVVGRLLALGHISGAEDGALRVVLRALEETQEAEYECGNCGELMIRCAGPLSLDLAHTEAQLIEAMRETVMALEGSAKHRARAWRAERERDDLRKEITEVRESLRRAGSVGGSYLTRAERAEQRVAALDEAVRGMLMSADAAWEEHDLGHDWRESCEEARAALAQKDEPR